MIILDNKTTAMTGHQENPVTGKTLSGASTVEIDIEALCRAVGVKHVYVVNPNEIDETYRVLKREIRRAEPSVVITKSPCVLLPTEKMKKKPVHLVVPAKCTGCRTCLQLGCPAIEWVGMTGEEAVALDMKPKQKGYSRINPVLCDGCGQCTPLCKFQAIEGEKGDEGE